MKLSKKFLHALVILTLMSFFMFGCGNAEVPADTKTETKDVAAEAPETTAEVEESVEEQLAEETLANELIMNSDPIADWVSTLEEEDLKFIIYNDVEGYKQI